MAELADAHGSGPCGSNTMRVQVPFPARIERIMWCLLHSPFFVSDSEPFIDESIKFMYDRKRK